VFIYRIEPYSDEHGSFVRVGCPRCGHSFVADNPWSGRACPRCARTSRRPDDTALVYDGSDTVEVTMGEAQAISGIVVGYSPKDGPNGIMFRPLDGKTIRDVYDSLARFN